jgi:hypothetical protein
MKHFVKKNPNDFRECFEPCPFMNSTELLGIHNKTQGLHFRTLQMIGSGACQKCEHHNNNNIIEEFGENYNVNRGSITWIECEKLNEL